MKDTTLYSWRYADEVESFPVSHNYAKTCRAAKDFAENENCVTIVYKLVPIVKYEVQMRATETVLEPDTVLRKKGARS